ncbi:MAG: hypothetical protein R3Y23_03255 [Bacillota bacterium]
MANLLLGTVLLVFSTFIGIKIDAYYKERSLVIKEWSEFLYECNKKITYFKTDILTIMRECEQQKIAKDVLELSVAMEKSTELIIDNVYLNDKEKATIVRFFMGITGCDIEAQTTLTECTMQDIAVQMSLAERQKKERGELIKKLMILLGITLMIIVL